MKRITMRIISMIIVLCMFCGSMNHGVFAKEAEEKLLAEMTSITHDN